MQCTKCHQEMSKKGVIHSGNSKYQQWQCSPCRTESTQAIGLNFQMPKDALYGTR